MKIPSTTNKVKVLIIRNIVVGMISLILQGIWEYVACGAFYDNHVVENMTALMIQATLGDVAITLVIFNLLILLNRNIRWKMDLKDLLIIVLYAFAATAFFESRAILETRWAYSEEMMYFFGSGIALVPVLQLVILLPVSMVIESLLVNQ